MVGCAGVQVWPLLLSLFSLQAACLPARSHDEQPSVGRVKNIFAFGDSYTDVGFNVTGLLPNPSNYEGNPVPPGTSASYATNWVEAFCSEFNSSLIYLYDFAHSGAIVNSTLVSPYESVNNTFTAQVDNQFLPYFGRPSAGGDSLGEEESGAAAVGDSEGAAYAGRRRSWRGDDSLFAVFFGINDIDRALGGDYPFEADWDARLPLIMDTYWSYVDKLYAAGARKFVFLNLPAYWRSPDVADRNNGSSHVAAVARRRNLLWNAALGRRFAAFLRRHEREHEFDEHEDDDDDDGRHPHHHHDSDGDGGDDDGDDHSFFARVVDVYGLWEDMYARPWAYGLRNVTGYCQAYYYGTGRNLTAFDPSCSAPVNEYLWLNWLHPTWTVQRYLARLVVDTTGYR
ncbi:GDSL lipase/esterase [Xylariaceae sp. FL0804]|nr:GDSL lipase/esterase [Xylariaceae sp. FL0804]